MRNGRRGRSVAGGAWPYVPGGGVSARPTPEARARAQPAGVMNQRSGAAEGAGRDLGAWSPRCWGRGFCAVVAEHRGQPAVRT